MQDIMQKQHVKPVAALLILTLRHRGGGAAGRLRRKLGDDSAPRYLETEAAVGLRFLDEG